MSSISHSTVDCNSTTFRPQRSLSGTKLLNTPWLVTAYPQRRALLLLMLLQASSSWGVMWVWPSSPQDARWLSWWWGITLQERVPSSIGTKARPVVMKHELVCPHATCSPQMCAFSLTHTYVCAAKVCWGAGSKDWCCLGDPGHFVYYHWQEKGLTHRKNIPGHAPTYATAIYVRRLF